MAADNTQLEALKLVADWCKTLVTIDTAAIAAIGAFLKVGNDPPISDVFRYSSSAAIVAFVMSILLTIWMMVSVPTSIQDIEPGKSIWDRPAIFLTFSLPTWVLAYSQMLLFLVGVVAFCTGAIGRLLM